MAGIIEQKAHVLPGVVLGDDQTATQGVTELMLASYHGNVTQVQQMLLRDSQMLQTKNHNNVTALDYAVSGKQMKVIDVMLGHSLKLDGLDTRGFTILHRCVLSHQLDKVKFCVELGMTLDQRSSDGDTSLILAVQHKSTDIAKYLIDIGCDVIIRNREGFSALDYAFCGNLMEIQKAIEKVNMPVKTEDASAGRTLMRISSQGSAQDMVDFMSTHKESLVNFRDDRNNGATPFMSACQYGNIENAKILKTYGADINKGIILGDTPLISAAIHCQSDVLDWLISEKVLLNATNTLGRTALHCTVIEGNLHIVQQLVKGGILLNLKSDNGSSALHIAVEKGFNVIVKYLLEQGAYVDPVNEDATTPLGLAALKGDLDCVKHLVEHQANMNRPQTHGYSPVMLGVNNRNMEVVRYLVAQGADLMFQSHTGASAMGLAASLGRPEMLNLFTQTLENRGVVVRQRDSNMLVLEHVMNDRSPQENFLKICKTGGGSFEELEGLVRDGADVNASDGQGMTALIMSVVHNQGVFVRWLIENRVELDSMDSLGMTALMHAAEGGHLELVTALVQASADLTITDSQGRTALDIAESSRHLDVASFLLSTENRKSREKQKRFFDALRAMDYEKCKRLAATGTDVRCFDECGCDGLWYCIGSDSAASCRLASLLCRAGVDLEHCDLDGKTPLEQCVYRGRPDIADSLLEHGALLEPHLPDLLMEASFNMDRDMVKIIVKYIHLAKLKDSQTFVNLGLKYAIDNDQVDLIPLYVNNDFNIGEFLQEKSFWSDQEHNKGLFLCESVRLGDLKPSEAAAILQLAVRENRSDIVKRMVDTPGMVEAAATQEALYSALESGQYEVAAILCSSNIEVLDIVNPSVVDEATEKWSVATRSSHTDKENDILYHTLRTIEETWRQMQSLVFTGALVDLKRYQFYDDITGLAFCEETATLHVYTTPESFLTVQESVGNILPGVPHHDMISIQLTTHKQPPETLVSYNLESVGHMPNPGTYCIASVGSHTAGACYGTVGCFLQDARGSLYALTSSHCLARPSERRDVVTEVRTTCLLAEGGWKTELSNQLCYIVDGDVMGSAVMSQNKDSDVTDRSVMLQNMNGDNTNNNLVQIDMGRNESEDYWMFPYTDSNDIIQGSSDMISLSMDSEDMRSQFNTNKGGMPLNAHSGGIEKMVMSSASEEGEMCVMSLSMAVVCVSPEVQRIRAPRLTEYLYCGHSHTLLGRRVHKTGCGSGTTRGRIVEVDVSFRACCGSMYHGGFVVTSDDPSVKFATPGDLGAAVSDCESGVVFGLIQATQRGYYSTRRNRHYHKPTFCMPLYPALSFLQQETGLQLGHFRNLSTSKCLQGYSN